MSSIMPVVVQGHRLRVKKVEISSCLRMAYSLRQEIGVKLAAFNLSGIAQTSPINMIRFRDAHQIEGHLRSDFDI